MINQEPIRKEKPYNKNTDAKNNPKKKEVLYPYFMALFLASIDASLYY